MIASIRQDNREFQYQVYVTDVLQVIAENTGHMSGAFTKQGKAPKKRFVDLVTRQKQQPKEEPKQSGKDIARGIIGGLNK